MYDKENEFVPLNFEKLSKNAAVWEVIKEEMQYLKGDCLMKIITPQKNKVSKTIKSLCQRWK